MLFKCERIVDKIFKVERSVDMVKIRKLWASCLNFREWLT